MNYSVGIRSIRSSTSPSIFSVEFKKFVLWWPPAVARRNEAGTHRQLEPLVQVFMTVLQMVQPEQCTVLLQPSGSRA